MRKGERGISIVEVLIALGVLGIIAATFLTALAVSGNSVIMTDEDATAESIARSQMEYIREQQYVDAPVGEVRIYAELDISAEHPNYSIWSVNRDEEVVEEVVGIPWDSEDNVARMSDIGLQRIKLVIKHDDKEALVIETYKVKR